jgi:hypothetical protein
MCLYPVKIKNPRYSGILTEQDYQWYDEDVVMMHVPCGKCSECLQKRQMQWSFRLEAHAEQATSATFVTLTYDDSSVPTRRKNGKLVNTLYKKDFVNFMKRLRKHTRDQHNPPLRYFACGEYGSTTHRPHYHAIIFNLPQPFEKFVEKAWSRYNGKEYKPIGFVGFGEVNEKTIKYVTKYTLKGNKAHKPQRDKYGREPEFNLMSKGLGENWISPARVQYLLENKTRYVKLKGGDEVILPRYLVEKLPFKNQSDRDNYISESAHEMRERFEEKIQVMDMAALDRYEYQENSERLFNRKMARKNETL